MNKRCGKCKQTKPIEACCTDNSRKDKHLCYCRKCDSNLYTAYYKQNTDNILLRQRTYWKSKEGKKSLSEMSRRKILKHPVAHKARYTLRYAVRTGKISKPDICDYINKSDFPCAGRIEGHHWKDVMWLCIKHHSKLHTQLRVKI